MSIMSWNCQGLGRPQGLTIQRLREMRQYHFPDILFLMETKKCRNVLVDLQVWLGYAHVYTINPVGFSGGLALFWKKNVQVDVLTASKNVIDCSVNLGDFSFLLSCVYGEPITNGRSVIWERLSRIGGSRRVPWCMVGDFNEILNNQEKTGGPLRHESSFQPFADMLSCCGMEELSSKGDRFTWGGLRWKKWIQCCLDRCFANKEWTNLFPGANQRFLEKRGSDHRPVFVSLRASAESFRGRFCFDKRLLLHSEVKIEVQSAWKGRHHNTSVSEKISICRRAMSKWKKKRVFNAKDKIHILHERLEWFQTRPYPCFFAINIIKKEIIRAYREEEMHWSQKSRDKWLVLGDRNSKFFHASVKTSRARKCITKLKDDDGELHWSDPAKGEVATAYFTKLFTTSCPRSYEPVFQSLVPKVTVSMNETLTSPISTEEVKEAMFSIKPESAPGPDGMSALFFQKYWDVVGEDITKEIRDIFEEGSLPEDWNYTYICLLPKIPDPEAMTDLRPISLCSVLYKVVSKILIHRLQPVLPDIVSVNQSAFVSERLISDNIIIAHEAVHALKVLPSVAAEYMAVKTDMSKAYDKVEWSYLRSLLVALGFDQKWVKWIMMCVTSVSFSVLINDQPFGLIKPQRGLRQGDPLSPFLFVLCTEGLSHLLEVAERNGVIEGMRFEESGPSIHHLFFADDSS